MFLTKFFKNHLTIPQATELFEEVKSQTHPDIANLKRLVDFHKAPVGTKDELQALNLKYRAMTHVPTTIEKTMTPAQLFAVESPLWALDYEPDKIKQMINHPQNYPKSEEIFNIVLEEVSNGIIAINKFGATI